MKDVINRIINADKKSREIVARTLKFKVDSIQKMSDLREKKKTEHINKARQNIKIMESEERKIADMKIKAITDRYNEISENIDKVYYENAGVWVSQIIQRVKEGL
ncbi:MAG: hypothetical protein LBR79_03565 [Oscillospiraceae bacterium]|jgi:hypothetical protein|nr:hypothetical protein [Oscillospiraceae bacterium]